MENFKFLVDSHHGIYMPKVFIDLYSESLNISSFCDVSILSNPDSEFYWDEYDTLLNNFEYKDNEGNLWVLFDNEDLWLVPAGTDLDEFII